jgi:hypothetical protein
MEFDIFILNNRVVYFLILILRTWKNIILEVRHIFKLLLYL